MKTLLIVDDSKTFQRLLEQILSTHFKVVAKGSNGHEGFSLYQQYLPDLVLMDITMPNCSGKESLEKIIQFNAKAKVAMVSGIGDDQTALECKRLGAVIFINKDKVSLSAEGKSYLLNVLLEILQPPNSKEAA
jgi:DNA-binding NarL/FixJ family response regulator